MQKVTNAELVQRIITATEEGRIDWQPTAKPQEFTANFGGKWTLVIFDWGPGSRLDMVDSEGELLIRVVSEENLRVPELHEMARRHALKIDEAVVDLLNEIDKPKN